MIVEPSDFTARPYRIPNREESQDFIDFLENYEARVLKDILGYSLYHAFKTALAGGSPADKWVKLRDGAEYTQFNTLYKYEGMKALLVPYLYSMWLKETVEKHTAEGVLINSNSVIQGTGTTNTESVSPSRKISSAYNHFSDQVGDWKNQGNTLYGFLTANIADYESWHFTEPGTMNIWNI